MGTGPLVVVLGDLDRTAADFLAKVEASPNPISYIGRGWAMPDGYAPDGLWLHVYATEQSSVLEVALDAVTTAVGTAGGGQPNASDLGSVETQKGNTE